MRAIESANAGRKLRERRASLRTWMVKKLRKNKTLFIIYLLKNIK
jgi:hypothetical protein